jgi:hypothetical protein
VHQLKHNVQAVFGVGEKLNRKTLVILTNVSSCAKT